MSGTFRDLPSTIHSVRVQLVAKKGNYQNKIGTFLQFHHSVKNSYER
jgi:hypothetical protein